MARQDRTPEEREAFLRRLLEEEMNAILVDITTGEVLGKRKDVEARSA